MLIIKWRAERAPSARQSGVQFRLTPRVM